MPLINYISPLDHPTSLRPNSFLSLALIRSLSNLLSIVNQITLVLLMLLFVLTVTLATVTILSNVLSTNFFKNFVNLTTLTIFALTQILIPPLLLVKNFLFDVDFKCMTMILMQLMLRISFLMNAPNKIEYTFQECRVYIPSVFSIQFINSRLFFRVITE